MTGKDDCESCTKEQTSKTFVVDTEVKEILYLKVNGEPLGRFCQLAGCNKRLKGKVVTTRNWRTGKVQKVERPVPKSQKFCSEYHKTRAYDIRKSRDKTSMSSISCSVRLNIEHDDEGQYREMVLYLIKNNKIISKIRPENKELWETMNKIAYYRHTHHKEKIKAVNLLTSVNTKR